MQGENKKMSDWKDLEIGNIPNDFFVNERYVLVSDKLNESEMFIRQQVKNRVNVIVDLGEGVKYRYRLKPLESMRVSRKAFEDLVKISGCNGFDGLRLKYGHKVEIIGE